MHTIRTDKSGNAIIYSVIIAAIMFTVTLTLTNTLLTSLSASGNISLSNRSFFAAEAGIEKGIYDLSGHGPGYRPDALDLNLDTQATIDLEIDNRIYDYTQILLEEGDSATIPLYYDASEPDDTELTFNKVLETAVNFDFVYLDQVDLLACPVVPIPTPENLPGDFRVSWLFEQPGTVGADDYDLGNSISAPVLSGGTVDDYFCWVKDINNTDSLYLVQNDAGDIRWINLTYAGNEYDADDLDPTDKPGDCEDGEPGESDLTLLKRRLSTIYQKTGVGGTDDYNYNYYLDSNDDDEVSEDDFRFNAFFLDGSNGQDIDYSSINSPDLDTPIADISYKLVVDTAVDQLYDPDVTTIIYGQINSAYYQIYPQIDFTTSVDISSAEFVNNVKSNKTNFSRGFTLYLDHDTNNIVNPNVISRWTAIYRVPLSEDSLVASKNFTSSINDLAYWNLSFYSCEPAIDYSYHINTNIGNPYNIADNASTPDPYTGNPQSLSNLLTIGTYPAEDMLLTINAYQNILFVLDPDPSTAYETLDDVPPDTPRFIPSPYVYLRSTGTAGNLNESYTEQTLQTRLEQNGTIPLFNQTVVF